MRTLHVRHSSPRSSSDRLDRLAKHWSGVFGGLYIVLFCWALVGKLVGSLGAPELVVRALAGAGMLLSAVPVIAWGVRSQPREFETHR